MIKLFLLFFIILSLRTENSNEAAQLSGMAQSFGYLLPAFGPILFGFLHDATNSWKVPLQALIGITVLLFIFGLGASRNRYVGSSLKVVR
ncbi:transporter, major facilitator family [Clostridium botulinum B str. Osaka05]|uniref:Transporter, major facilitator family n=1 Tax=Clostridium botulinum B str. Osaka05 TaxID=1407017 RepID=A0A0S6U5Z9_CLOBO|nr:transporter, major facilitator family [Clostridium botulinum B str. Osaka05]